MSSRSAGTRGGARAPGVVRGVARGVRGVVLAASLAVAAGAALGAPPFAAPLAAQTGRGIEIRLAAPGARLTEGPIVRVTGVLNRGELRDLVNHNFPLRLHYRVELWSTAGWFDDLRGSWEWDVVIRRDPLVRTYQVVRLAGDQATLLGDFATHAEAVEAAERPYRVPLLPRRGERQYYTAKVEIEALSLSDLDEVERWLRGELRPAVRGQRNPGTALGRGIGKLAARLLGSESAEYGGRTTAFRP